MIEAQIPLTVRQLRDGSTVSIHLFKDHATYSMTILPDRGKGLFISARTGLAVSYTKDNKKVIDFLAFSDYDEADNIMGWRYEV